MNLSFLWEDFKGWNQLDYEWLIGACVMITAATLMMDGSTISIISAIANVVCVILVAQGKLSNYVWGTVGVITYAYLAYTWGYFGETFLNIGYYLPMQFIGFYFWNKNQGNNDQTSSDTVFIRSLSKSQRWLGIASIPVLIGVGAYVLYMLEGKLVVFDATTTVLSIIAMMLMAARMKEQWYLWIIVNVVSVYMWSVSFMSGNVDGFATLLMWIVFLVNSIYGLLKWSSVEEKVSE